MIKMSAVQKKSNKSTSGSAKKKSTSRPELVQTKESPTTSATKPSTSTSSPIAQNQEPPASIKPYQNQPANVEDTPPPITLQYYREFSNDNYLSEYRQSRDISSKHCRENNLRVEITALQTKISQDIQELENGPSIRSLFQRAVNHAEENMGICEEVEKELTGDYLKVVDVLNIQMGAIKEIIEQSKKVYDDTVEEDKLFEQKYQQDQHALENINKDLQFATKTRDDVCIQIAEMAKILSKINPMIDDCRESNSKLAEEICAVQSKFENEERSMNIITNRALNWIQEKTEALNKLKEEKVQLKKEKKKIRTALSNVKGETNILCAEVNELKIESDKMENLVNRIQNANKNLRESIADRSDFNERRSVLLEKIKKVTDNTVALQEKTAKKQNRFIELKQMREEILKKKQRRSELQQKLLELKNKKWKQEHKISIVQKYVNETKSFVDQNVATANQSKREHLSRDSRRDSTYSFDSKDFRNDE